MLGTVDMVDALVIGIAGPVFKVVGTSKVDEERGLDTKEVTLVDISAEEEGFEDKVAGIGMEG